MGELYRLDFPNGKAYIGITETTSAERFKSHRRASRNKNFDYLVYRAWRKYGEPKLTVLAVVENYDLAETEIRAISIFKTLQPNGYNLSTGGEVSPMKIPEVALKFKGTKMSEDAKQKMRNAHKTRWTKEAREKVSREQKGKIISEDCKVKMRIAMSNYWTDERRKEQSEKLKSFHAKKRMLPCS